MSDSEHSPAPASSDDPSRRRRLLFRAAHRGTRELDLLLGGFVARHLGELDAAALDDLETVLDLADVDLADWLSGRRPIPATLDLPLLHRIAAASQLPGAGMPDAGP